MPLTVTQIRVGISFYLTGRLNVAADGSRGRGKSFSNYKVRIVRILDRDVPYPILLGDNFSDQLGWVSAAELRGEVTVGVTKVTIA